MQYIKTHETVKRYKVKKEYFDHLEHNKEAFYNSFEEDEQIEVEAISKSGNDSKVLKLVKALSKVKTLTDDQELKLKQIRQLVEEGIYQRV